VWVVAAPFVVRVPLVEIETEGVEELELRVWELVASAVKLVKGLVAESFCCIVPGNIVEELEMELGLQVLAHEVLVLE